MRLGLRRPRTLIWVIWLSEELFVACLGTKTIRFTNCREDRARAALAGVAPSFLRKQRLSLPLESTQFFWISTCTEYSQACYVAEARLTRTHLSSAQASMPNDVDMPRPRCDATSRYASSLKVAGPVSLSSDSNIILLYCPPPMIAIIATPLPPSGGPHLRS
jgi:hypothetical protein